MNQKANVPGEYLARKMANSKPMTKRAMLRKWPSLGSIEQINLGIDWIERNTTLSDNPFLFLWDRGEAVWGFRKTFGKVGLNLDWNLRYLMTRLGTFQRVLDHAIASPVVEMNADQRRAATAISAQTVGTLAFLDSMADLMSGAIATDGATV